MRDITLNPITPQRKAIGVSKRFGNLGLKKQQGTTRILYDSLPFTGSPTQFNFFEGSNNRDFPFTNVGASGNKLTVGELLVIERFYLAAIQVEDTGELIEFEDVITGTGSDALATGDLSLEIANQTVMKPISAASALPQFNKNAYWDNYNNFEMDTQIVLQPLLEYIWRYRVTLYPVQADEQSLRLTIEGTGAIIAPRQTM